jgi:hypothetical protein
VLWVDDKVLVVGCVGIIIYLTMLLFSRLVQGLLDVMVVMIKEEVVCTGVHQKAPKHVVCTNLLNHFKQRKCQREVFFLTAEQNQRRNRYHQIQNGFEFNNFGALPSVHVM